MNMAIRINIYAPQVFAKNRLLSENWASTLWFLETSLNQYFTIKKNKLKGIKVFNIEFLGHFYDNSPTNPLGDTISIHYRLMDDNIFKNDKTEKEKRELVLKEVYNSLQLLCKQKNLPENTFEDAYQWVSEKIA
ncbi:MAG: hypothetical protein MUE30_08060 [Spirosomaceae bacterium]|jgi:hypothetical protein|nr:hypothetical protein [Spirosomataceae bacterium]